ncbi:amidohydrolase family protein [Nocardia jiangxiensis]|uniref:Amidohydrolase family protein n=1 Tax=Nocardia jiangxiensis TaxID=282685 RepID=A0ABW6RRC0_9NOCA|nr:amidohydrolase family protein [Nocardia jiangxiensis]
MSRITLISSDGHVAAHMGDYRPYLESRYHEDFDAFLIDYRKYGVVTTDSTNIMNRLDPDVAAEWQEKVTNTGRLEASWDPARRVAELDREGIAAEVLFQEFATPFLMSSPTHAATLQVAQPTDDQLSAGYRAYNRWVSDFRAYAPHRWAPMAAISLHDVEAAVTEIEAVKEMGFSGIALPALPGDDRPYQPQYDRIWAALQDNDLVVNIHVAIGSTLPSYTQAPTLTSARAMVGADIFTSVRNLLPALIFGGVLERFPRLRIVFTETHSDWVLGALQRMDHSYDRSDLRRDIREVVPMRPSEYWRRQCYLGSSLFSRAEVAARHRIGLDKMMIGIDFPHSEGAWRFGTREYVKATFGAEHVPAVDARKMFGSNAAAVFGFDLPALDALAEKIGLDEADALTPPEVQPTYRGDLDRPLIGA